ncbi:MAG: DUF1538 domain-containing protein [Ruminococcaceae bacterium]|nr:DUF1538 domain-containing protein [Oscillospiraceae bacterium]
MDVIVAKLKEVLFSVTPIIIMVLLLKFTVTPLGADLTIRFLLGSFLVIVGLTLFLIGVDLGITPLGNLTGTTLAKTNRIWIVMTAGLVLGFFISIAEPGLLVLANQVDQVTSGLVSDKTILLVVSLGLATLIALGFLRVFFNVPLYKMLLALYLMIFGLSIFTSREFLAIAFDASGATTGVLAVPFILALSVGISRMKKDSKASEKDSFGLVAIASTGAIISVLLLDVLGEKTNFLVPDMSNGADQGGILLAFLRIIPEYLKDSLISILPLLVVLIVLQLMAFRLKKREMRKLLTGFAFAFIGLFIFLVGVNAGFMDIGIIIGRDLALKDNKAYILIISFILGVVTILAEPAVYVLTHQIEDVTSGYVKRKVVLVTLAAGVGIAVALSVVRILTPGIQLWHYLLPGYVISLGLMFFAPKLFVGIAFDAGGVATGPMTATFIMAFIQGAANAHEGADLLIDGFGMIAMVAMMPIITLQLLGLVYGLKRKKTL